MFPSAASTLVAFWFGVFCSLSQLLSESVLNSKLDFVLKIQFSEATGSVIVFINIGAQRVMDDILRELAFVSQRNKTKHNCQISQQQIKPLK